MRATRPAHAALRRQRLALPGGTIFTTDSSSGPPRKSRRIAWLAGSRFVSPRLRPRRHREDVRREGAALLVEDASAGTRGSPSCRSSIHATAPVTPPFASTSTDGLWHLVAPPQWDAKAAGTFHGEGGLPRIREAHLDGVTVGDRADVVRGGCRRRRGTRGAGSHRGRRARERPGRVVVTRRAAARGPRDHGEPEGDSRTTMRTAEGPIGPAGPSLDSARASTGTDARPLGGKRQRQRDAEDSFLAPFPPLPLLTRLAKKASGPYHTVPPSRGSASVANTEIFVDARAEARPRSRGSSVARVARDLVALTKPRITASCS